MTTPRTTHPHTRITLEHLATVAAFLGLLTAPAILAAVPTPVAVVIALSVALCALAGYVALGRRAR